MAQGDLWKRYLDAGMEFSQMTRARAEGIVRDLIKAGEVQREQRQQRIEELLERSRKNTEDLVNAVRKEIDRQLSAVGVATKADLEKLEKKIDSLSKAQPATPAKAPAKKAPAAKKA